MAREELLGRAHQGEVLELQESLPDSYRCSPDRWRERLEMLEKTPPRLSWVAFDQERASGYLIAYLGPSAIESATQEMVILIGDIATARTQSAELFRLLQLLRQSIEANKLERLALEANCRSQLFQMLQSHPRVLERLGYELVADHSAWSAAVSEELTWVRLHPIQQTQRQVNGDAISWSEELLQG